MKCSRCAAELPDSSTYCSHCGTANPTGQLTTSGFSYLPAGAPPWPASVPGRYPYGATSPAPPQSVEPRLTERSGSSAARSLMVVSLILLVSLLVGVGGTLGILAGQGRLSPQPVTAAKKVVAIPTPQAAGATPATTAQANQLPTPTSFKTANIKDVNVALEYPSSWVQDALQKSSDGTLLDIHSPQDQQIGIGFSLMRYSSTTSTTFASADQINQGNIQGFSQLSGVSNMQTVPTNGSAPTIGGVTWTELDASFLNSSSVKIDMMSMVVKHNNIYYNILVLAPDIYYPEAMQKYIQHIFSTFKFLS